MKKILLRIILFCVLLSVAWVLVLKYLPPVGTSLMLIRSVQHRTEISFKTSYKWRSYHKISPELVKAVITSEDNRYDMHSGFDWQEIRKARQENREGRRIRGASTISQQTAKNVFLWPRRSWIRKGLEMWFTFLIEKIWGKRRIMEVYLNVAEMGPGIYGAEAAARAFFSCSAKDLTRSQACAIAACLPDPLHRSAAKPGPYVRSRTAKIAAMEKNLVFPDWVSSFGVE